MTGGEIRAMGPEATTSAQLVEVTLVTGSLGPRSRTTGTAARTRRSSAASDSEHIVPEARKLLVVAKLAWLEEQARAQLRRSPGRPGPARHPLDR